jgi:hypothetical protein
MVNKTVLLYQKHIYDIDKVYFTPKPHLVFITFLNDF